jgi:hypothetical protein
MQGRSRGDRDVHAPRPVAALLATVLAVLLATPVPAVEVPIPGGLGLVRRDVASAQGGLVKLSSRRSRDEAPFPLPAAGGPDDPRSVGGTFLRSQCSGGTGASCLATPGSWTPILLPAAGWKALGSPPGSKGYRYRGNGADPCRLALVKPRSIRVTCKGAAAVDPLFVQPVPVLVADDLILGATRYCTQWLTSYSRNNSVLWRDEDQSAPPDCPNPTGTPTPTPTPVYGSAARAFLAAPAVLLE